MLINVFFINVFYLFINLIDNLIIINLIKVIIVFKENGDWGLGIGDCPIPNPQSQIPNITLTN